MKRALATFAVLLALPAGASASISRLHGRTKISAVTAVVHHDNLRSITDKQALDCFDVRTYGAWALVNTTSRPARYGSGECILHYRNGEEWQPTAAIVERNAGGWADKLQLEDGLQAGHTGPVPTRVIRGLGLHLYVPSVLQPTVGGPVDSRYLKQHPNEIIYAGDGSGYLGQLRWSGWGRRTSRATGFNALDDCEPSCAQGTFRHYPVSVTAYDKRLLGPSYVYARLRVSYTGAIPTMENGTSAPKVNTYSVEYNARYDTYFYNFPTL